MKPWILASIVIAGSVAGASSARQPEVVFFDDFAAPELDRTKWNVIVTGRTVNNEQQAYVDSAEVLRTSRGADVEGAENGALIVQPRFHEGFMTPENRRFDFTSGRLESRGKVEFTYGTASARIKLSKGAGLWPAFWALGAGRWPDTGEMDIMENVGDPGWTNVALHGPGYSGNTPFTARRPFPPTNDITGWHVYSMEWTTNGFVFKVDDDVFYKPTREMVEKYGRWAYDTPKFLIVNFALGGQYPQAVNHIATPYPGLAAETVDLIKANKAMMIVDWVRVTRERVSGLGPPKRDSAKAAEKSATVSPMRLRSLTLALAVTVSAGACADHLPDQDLRILDSPPAAKTSPEALWKEYQADARAANRSYHGKAIDVSGKISQIVQEPTGSRIMFIVQPPPGTAGIEARLLDDRATATLAGLAAAQRLTLRCFVEGFDKNVILKSCIKPVP